MKEINRAYEMLSAHLHGYPNVNRDRRKYPRITCSLSVYHTSNDQPCNSLHAGIENISADGLFLRTSINYWPGQKLSLNYRLPKFGELIGLSGKVLRKIPEGVGVKFQISDTYRNFLAAFV